MSQRAHPAKIKTVCTNASSPYQIPASLRQATRGLIVGQSRASGPIVSVNTKSRKLLSPMARHKRISGSQFNRPHQNGRVNTKAINKTVTCRSNKRLKFFLSRVIILWILFESIKFNCENIKKKLRRNYEFLSGRFCFPNL